MLPECRMIDDPYAIPKYDITVDDMDSCLEELKGFP